jgi:hypothetical protein
MTKKESAAESREKQSARTAEKSIRRSAASQKRGRKTDATPTDAKAQETAE